MNSALSSETIGKLLSSAFLKQGTGYMTLIQFRQFLTAAEKRALGITAKSNQQDIKRALGDLPSPYQYLKYASSWFIIKQNVETLFLLYLGSKKEKTLGQAIRGFPLNETAVIELVNRLVDNDALKVKIRSTKRPALVPIVSSFPLVKKPSGNKLDKPSSTGIKEEKAMVRGIGDDTIKQFKTAYDQVSRGAHYVYIHLIRHFLSWPRKRFDETMDFLMESGYLAAHPGNPRDLTSRQIADSFQDEFGDLYITVSWRKPV